MRSQILIISGLLLTMGCASSFKDASNKNWDSKYQPGFQKSESNRTPTSVGRYLKDQYGDVLVYFCSEDSAVVVMDPNKCNQALANGAIGCTELSPYFSSRLTVQRQGGDLELIAGGKSKHSLKATNEGFEILDTRGDVVEVNWHTANDSQLKTIESYYCK